MRILIEGTTWWNRRGFGRFTRELLKALLRRESENEYTLIVDQPFTEKLPGAPLEILRVKTSRPSHQAASANSNRSVLDLLKFTGAARRGKFDLIFFPAVYSYFPVFPGPEILVTFHDAIAETHSALIFPRRKNKLFWDLKVKVALRQATRLLVVSNSSREQVVKALKVGPGRIDQVTEGADAIFQPLKMPRVSGGVMSKYGIAEQRRFLLYVGGISPHKNILTLVKCLRTGKIAADVHLVLVGDKDADGFHANFQEIDTVLQQDPELKARVHFTGFVPDQELVEFYNRAAAFIIPSYAEGFGLCPLEAMACGTPVLSSNGGSLPEVLDHAAIYFDPFQVDEIIEKTNDLLASESLQQDMSRKSLARAADYSWDKAAEMALESFRRTVRA